jgi:cAMP-dependent protein kinase regulator
VSAEAYGDWNQKKKFVAPFIPKNDAQKARLTKCLRKSFLFSALEESDLCIIIGAMKEVNLEANVRVIHQGDSGDFLFVVESGGLKCIVKSAGGDEKIVKTCSSGDVFGELALLYNCPRAASVEATEACNLWQLDRDTFNAIVKDAAEKKRARYDVFLSKVPLLSSMDAYERSQLADALRSETFPDAEPIVTQGEDGNKFYIVEDGEAIVLKDGVEVMQYCVGSYFGELALIKRQPRACTVNAKGVCKVLSLDSASFRRHLNIPELMKRCTAYT